MGPWHGPWTPRVAHRVFRDGTAASRRTADRHPRRRRRSRSSRTTRTRLRKAKAPPRPSSPSFWFHIEHLFVESEKMSKSLGNVYTIAEIAARGHRPSALRYLLLSSHYRKQLNFTWTGMDQAEEAIRRIVDFRARLETVAGSGVHTRVAEQVAKARDAFRAALEHDLNTAAALAAVFDLVRDVNAAIDAQEISASEARAVAEAIDRFRSGAGCRQPSAGRGLRSRRCRSRRSNG